MEKFYIFIISNKQVDKFLFNIEPKYNRFNSWRLSLINKRNFKGRFKKK